VKLPLRFTMHIEFGVDRTRRRSCRRLTCGIPPGRRGSYGDEVVDWSASIGHPVDAEQALAIDAGASYGPGGNYLALEFCVKEGRQNGKTDRTVLPMTLADLFLFGVRVVTWTSHLMDTSLATFKVVKGLIDGNASLSRRVREVVESKSEQSIVLMSGATMEFRTRVRGGGRGRTGDVWVADEALFLTGEQMGSRLSTLSSRPNPQVRYASSAALAESTHLRSLTRRGRAMSDPSLVFVEWKAPGGWKDPGCVQGLACSHAFGTPGCTLDREELYHLANHAAGRRISYAFMRTERRTLPPLELGRERLGWDEDGPDDGLRHPLDSEDYTATATAAAPQVVSPPVFFVTVGPDDLAVVAAAAARADDGRPHVELARRVPAAQLAEVLEDLDAAWPGARFGAGKSGPVGGMVEAGLPVEVRLFTAAELAQACRHHERLNKDRTYTHSTDPDVDVSFAGAVSKLAGDKLWTWDWKTSANLAAIAAETGALWLLETSPGGEPTVYVF
jgi:hypothetical protein